MGHGEWQHFLLGRHEITLGQGGDRPVKESLFDLTLAFMKRIGISALLATALLVSALPSANAVVNPGSKCSKAGVKQTYKGKIYTCIKLGSKLYWNNGITQKKNPLTKAFAVGDVGPGGGIVFYVSPQVFASPGSSCGNNCKYFEVTTADIPNAHPWCSNNDGFIGATESRIGMGMSNTTKADLVCTSGAIQLAADYSQNKINDWHLPSKDELNLLANVSKSIGVFRGDLYYSSTEVGSFSAWSQIPEVNGFTFSPSKSISLWVRPVRAF